MPKVIHNKTRVNQKYAGTQVTEYKCPSCDYAENVNQWSRKSLHCPKCDTVGQHTVMRKAKVISAHKADEIRARQAVREPGEEFADNNPLDAWEMGAVQPRKSKVQSVGAGPGLDVHINKNKSCWENKIVHINGYPYRLADLGGALKGSL